MVDTCLSNQGLIHLISEYVRSGPKMRLNEVSPTIGLAWTPFATEAREKMNELVEHKLYHDPEPPSRLPSMADYYWARLEVMFEES